MKFHSVIRRLSLLAAVVGFLILSGRPALASEITADTRIQEGVLVLGQDLSGKTVPEAEDILDRAMESIEDSRMTVTFNGQQSYLNIRDLGLTWDTAAAVKEAASFGSSGPLIARYKEQKDLRYDSTEVAMEYSYNKLAIRSFVESVIAVQDSPARDASLSMEDGRLVVHEGVSGMETDIDATVNAITDVLDHSLSASMTAAAVITYSDPEVTSDSFSEITDCLATYSTDYSSSSSNRKTNISTATGRLNGRILAPGESLSVSDTILPRCAENGYLLAPQYVNGVTEDSYGGGVCQVSTTLYNALIRAELQIDTRYPHSMVVHYVPYASDAAISEGNKDLVFTNNTDKPVYIGAEADGETLTFSIFGHETRPAGRTIEFVSETLSENYPDPEITYDDNEYEGYESTTGTASPEVTATLTKVVYENGKEVSRTLLHTDSYAGRAKITILGTKEKEPDSTDSSDSDDSDAEEPETTRAAETSAARETTKAAETTAADEESWDEMVDPPEPDDEE